MIQKRAEDLLAKIEASIAGEFQRPQSAAVPDFLTVMPWAHHQKYLVVACVLWLDRFVECECAVDVFLVPKAVDEHYRNFERVRGKNLVHGLLLPPRIVTRMLEQFAPESDLFDPVPTTEFSGGTCFHECVVVVEMIGPPVRRVVTSGFLL